MGLGAGIEAGKAFVKFLLDDKELKTKLLGVGKRLRNFGAIGMRATGPILTAFGAFAILAANVGSQLHDMSKRTGLSVESLSELKYVAEQSGTSLEAVERAARELQKKGIDPKKFDEIANSIAAIEDPTQRAQAAMKEFGKRSGTALIPMLENLAEGRQRARDLGLVMSTQNAQSLDNLGDALKDVKDQLIALAVNIGVAIAGPLTDFLIWSSYVLSSVIAFIQNHQMMVQVIGAVIAAVFGVNAALYAFGTLMTIITLHPIVAALTAIAAAVASISWWFGSANDGAKDFNKTLDGCRCRGAVNSPTCSGRRCSFKPS